MKNNFSTQRSSFSQVLSLITSSASDRFDNETCFLFNECSRGITSFSSFDKSTEESRICRTQQYLFTRSTFLIRTELWMGLKAEFMFDCQQMYRKMLIGIRKGWITLHTAAIIPIYLRTYAFEKKSTSKSSLDKTSLSFLLIQKPHTNLNLQVSMHILDVSPVEVLDRICSDLGVFTVLHFGVKDLCWDYSLLVVVMSVHGSQGSEWMRHPGDFQPRRWESSCFGRSWTNRHTHSCRHSRAGGPVWDGGSPLKARRSASGWAGMFTLIRELCTYYVRTNMAIFDPPPLFFYEVK